MTDLKAVHVRERRDGDLAELGVVLTEVHASDGYPVEGVSDPVAWLHSAALVDAWVAVLRGRLVGHVALTRPGAGDDAAKVWSERSGQAPNQLAVLGRLFVAGSARGQGLGRRLVTTATDRADELGLRAVLDVMVKDVAAIATYEALGWKRLGPITHHFGDRTEPALAFVSPDRRRRNST